MEKTIDNKDTTIIPVAERTGSSDVPSLEKDKYSIFNYLKNHPASIIGCFSVGVAVITFFSQLLGYIASKNTLSYWNFNVMYASLGNKNLLYSAMTAMVYLIIISFTSNWFLKTSDIYIERKNCYLIRTLLCKYHKSLCKKYKRKVSKLKSNTNKAKKEIFELEKSIERLQQETKELKKELLKIKIKAHFFFLINILPIIFLTFVFSFTISIMLVPQEEILKSTIVFFCIHVIMDYLIFLLEKKTYINIKKIKKEIVTKDIEEVLAATKYENDYPLWALLKKGDRISNSVFISQVISIVLVFIIFIFSFALGSIHIEKTKKNFQITNIDGQQYAIVYYSDNTYYLEKINIEENILTIFTKDQRIINTSDISFFIQTFDEVIKID